MAELSLNVKLKAFEDVSKKFKAIREAGSKLSRQFEHNTTALKELNRSLNDVSAYKKQKQAMQESSAALERSREKLRKVQEQLRSPMLEHNSKQWRELSRQFIQASSSIARLEGDQAKEGKRLADLHDRLRLAGISTKNLSAAEQRLQADVAKTTGALERQSVLLQKMTALEQKAVTNKKLFQERMQLAGNMSMAGYAGVNASRRIFGTLAAPVKAFIEQEQASADLKVTMMRADGTSGAFEQLNEQTKRLGAVLPGTTQDFINLGRALKEQGVKDQILLGGGLEAAAQLGVLMNMDQADGGRFFARMIEAHGLQGDNLLKAADMMQRAYYSFGLKKEDAEASMSYYSGSVNSMGLTGDKNFKKLLAIQGMAARQGVEGSMFGTNFAEMLNRLGAGPRGLLLATKGLKAEARDALKKSGVEFKFYNADGSLKEIEAIVAELEKMKQVYEKVGEEDGNLIMQQMFGAQGGRVAKVLAMQGLAGFKSAMQDMDAQADIMSRIEEKTATLGAALEQLGGAWTLLSGTIGENLKDEIKALADTAQTFINNSLTPWIKENKTLVKNIMIGVAAIGALAAVGGVMLLAMAPITAIFSLLSFTLRGVVLRVLMLGVKLNTLSGAIKLGEQAFMSCGVKIDGFAKLLKTRLASALSSSKVKIGGMAKLLKTRLASALSSSKVKIGGMAKLLKTGLISALSYTKTGILSVGRALLIAGRFMLMNPIGLVITAIAGAAYLLYKNWDKVSKFLKDTWSKMTSWWRDTLSLLKADTGAGLQRIGAAILNWSPLGLVYKAFAGVMRYFGFEMPDNLSQALANVGRTIMDKIAEWDVLGWFKNAMSNAFKWVDDKIESLKQTWQKIKAFFTGEDSEAKSVYDYTARTGAKRNFAADQAALKRLNANQNLAQDAALYQQKLSGLNAALSKGEISLVEHAKRVDAITKQFGGPERVQMMLASGLLLGQNLGQGMAKGIESQAEVIAKASTKVTQGAIVAARKAGDVHSPSRVMAEIGQFFSQGFAVGIEKAAHHPAAAMANVANGIKKAAGHPTKLLRDFVGIPAAVGALSTALPLAAHPVSVAPPLSQSAAPVAQAAAPVINITINGGAAPDTAQAIAREVERVLKAHQDRSRARTNRALYDI